MTIPNKSLLACATKSLDHIRTAADKNRARLICSHRKPGQSEAEACNSFLERLVIRTLRTSDHPDLREIYDLYLQNFPIKAEQESYNGFNKVLSFNDDPLLQELFGPFEQVWLYVRDPDNNRLIGALNYIAFNLKKDAEASRYVDGTEHITYCCVASEYRRMGIAGMLMDRAEKRSKIFIGQTLEPLKSPSTLRFYVVNEQNQPQKMTLHDYFEDTRLAGIDQYSRLSYWTHRGFRRLNFSYIQLPLAEGKEAYRGLDLYFKVRDEVSIHRSVVEAHLFRFFSSFVLKGKAASDEPEWIEQRDELRSLQGVLLVKGSEAELEKKRSHVWELMNQQREKEGEGLYDVVIGEIPLVSDLEDSRLEKRHFSLYSQPVTLSNLLAGVRHFLSLGVEKWV